MWTVPLFQCLGYILVAITDPSEMPGFSVSANAGGDHTYMLALVSDTCITRARAHTRSVCPSYPDVVMTESAALLVLTIGCSMCCVRR